MIEFPLTLKLLPAARHEPAAWFIPGADLADWIAEMARWELPMERLRLYIVPTSSADRMAVGVLVETPPGARPAAVLRGLPYGRVAGRLFLPVDAALDPPPADAELITKLLHPVQVFHPAAGLVGFGEEDAIRVHELLAPPVERPMAWNCAKAGPADFGRLLGVEAEAPRRMQDIIEQGREDIGSRPSELLPRRPDESRAAQAAKAVKSASMTAGLNAAMAPVNFLKWLSRLLPKPRLNPASENSAGSSPATRPPAPARPGWLDGLSDWIARQFQGISKSLLDARMRELERLRHLLESNPDEGLRFAIPLRDLATRGRAEPGSKLTPHDPNFSLGRFNGIGAGDPWDIPPDYRASLTAQYRLAANRELKLGRYRRAAYIFADLLGDFSSAANALEQGRFYREAAVIYRDHLKSNEKAAECMERGGLLPEAAAMYEELGKFEKAGDLHAQLENGVEAVRCYRVQVGKLQPGDPLGAARLLEEKLHVPDEALAVLTRAWPNGDVAGLCLRASFRLLARLARHDETLARINRFRRDALPPKRAAELTLALGEAATTYPDASVRAACGDATRVLAGRLLPGAEAADRVKLARAVVPLAPQDRLLARDAERFLNPPKRKPAAAPATRRSSDPLVLRRFHLAGGLAWKAAVADDMGFCAMALLSKGLMFARGTWDGRTQGTFWHVPGSMQETWASQVAPGAPKNTTAPLPADGRELPFIHDSGKAPALPTLSGDWALQWMPGLGRITFTPALPLAGSLTLPMTGVFPAAVEIGLPDWLDKSSLRALTHDENGVTWALHDDSLRAYRSATGVIIATYALEIGPPTGDVRMIARAGQVCFSYETPSLTHWSGRFDAGGKKRVEMEPSPLPVRHLAATPPHAPLNIAAAYDNGLALLDDRYVIAEDIVEPLITFTRGGLLVAANARDCRIYQIENGACRRRGDFPGAGTGLIALTATRLLNEFATFTQDGTVTVYQIPT